jgi:predicted  nucleic acid-binding Zn-ribbon protein
METKAPQSQALPRDGGQNGQTPPADPVAQAEQALKEAQKALDRAKKKKGDDEKRQKDRDALKNQRAVTQIVIDDASAGSATWKDALAQALPEAARTELDQKIGAVDNEIASAEQHVNDLQNQISGDETALAAANQNLAALETQYADKQKELNQLPAKIKDVQSSIEKLRTEVKNAMDARDWSRAYYKNYRLQQALQKAGPLLDPQQAEKALVDALAGLQADIPNKQDDAETLKNARDTHKTALKAAEDDLKRKQAGLETTIDAFL